MVRFITDIFQHRQFFRGHLLRDLFQNLITRHLIRQRGDHNVTVILFIFGARTHTAIAFFIHCQQVIAAGNNFRIGGVVRAFDMLHQIRHTDFGFIQHADTGTGHFAQVMRWNVGGHTHRDTG